MKGAGSMFGIVTWIALGYGLVWGGLWMILSSMLLMLVSGFVLVPPVGMAALAGAFGAMVLLFADPAKRGRKATLMVAAASILLLLVHDHRRLNEVPAPRLRLNKGDTSAESECQMPKVTCIGTDVKDHRGMVLMLFLIC